MGVGVSVGNNSEQYFAFQEGYSELYARLTEERGHSIDHSISESLKEVIRAFVISSDKIAKGFYPEELDRVKEDIGYMKDVYHFHTGEVIQTLNIDTSEHSF